MFDWNDEELANTVWGEEGQHDDHIVPFPEASEDLHRKEWKWEASPIKLTEQKRTEAKTDFHGRKLGRSPTIDNSSGLSASVYGTNSWPDFDLSLSSAAKTDQGSLGTEAPKNLEETTLHEKDEEVFRNTREVQERGDIVDDGWANVGSFDDLDQIFSNDDSIFGHASLESSDELWFSKEVSNSATTPILLEASSSASVLSNRSEHFESISEYDQCNFHSLSLSCKKFGGPASHDTQNAHTTIVNAGYARIRSKTTGKEQQNQLKAWEKSLDKQEGKVLQNFHSNWSPSTSLSGQLVNQLAPSTMKFSTSSIPMQQKRLRGPETLYQNITHPYVESSVSGNLTNAYPAMSMLPQAQSGDLKRQTLLPWYEVSPEIVNPVKKSVDSLKPITMTPKEKIEKLRRRQQMQAMLGIQKQQQQLDHQVPSLNRSMIQNYPLEKHDGTDPEMGDFSALPALDLPNVQDDSNTTSVAIDDNFVEDTILYTLQDTISKLDIKIRLCIRDSLFRLAQSAMQRNCGSDTSSKTRSGGAELGVVARGDHNSQNRDTRSSEVETKTNPIDRTVARLLFHRPLELTRNYSANLDSPVSAKMQCENKAVSLENCPMGCLPDEDLHIV